MENNYFDGPNVNNNVSNSNNDDSGSALWSLLGCCIPIVGLVLFLVWKDTKPLTAKKAGIGAIIGVALVIVYYIIMIIVGFGMSMMY